MWAAAAQGPLTYHLWERVEIRKPATPRKTGQEVLVPVRGGVHEWRPVIKRPDILVVLQTPLCGYLKDSAGNPTGIPTWRKRLQRLPTERYATTREDLACRDCYQAYITSRSRSERKAAATAMTLGKAA